MRHRAQVGRWRSWTSIRVLSCGTLPLLVASFVIGGSVGAARTPNGVHTSSPASPHHWTSDIDAAPLDQWDAIQKSDNGRVTAPTSNIGYIRLSIEGGRDSDSPVERSEVALNTENSHGYEGSVVEYSWTTRIARLDKLERSDSWVIIAQWHQTLPNCPPNIALQYEPAGEDDEDRLMLYMRGGKINPKSCKPEHTKTVELEAPKNGRWLRFRALISWSAERHRGGIELELDGERIAHAKNLPTLYSGMGAYMKIGAYRSAQEGLVSIDLREITVQVRRKNVPSPDGGLLE